MSTRVALHFGYQRFSGHCLQGPDGESERLTRVLYPFCPWSDGLMDSGLLKNGQVPDTPDGRVFWTCGGAVEFWLAFVWWDRSGDRRANSNSGFYVRGFQVDQRQAALDFAGRVFPKVIERQRFPLVLQP